MTMSRITLVVPTGALEWAERMLLDDGGAPVSRYATPGMLAEMASARERALRFVRAHAATIAVGPILFHVGGNVQRATPLDKPEYATFAAMDYRFCLLDLLDGDAASTVIQKHYRGWATRRALRARCEAATVIKKHFVGWKARMATAFNPTTTLGAYYALREFRVMVGGPVM